MILFTQTTIFETEYHVFILVFFLAYLLRSSITIVYGPWNTSLIGAVYTERRPSFTIKNDHILTYTAVNIDVYYRRITTQFISPKEKYLQTLVKVKYLIRHIKSTYQALSNQRPFLLQTENSLFENFLCQGFSMELILKLFEMENRAFSKIVNSNNE